MNSAPKDPSGKYIVAVVTVVYGILIGIAIGAFIYSVLTNDA